MDEKIARLRPLLQEHHKAGFAWAVMKCGGNREEAEDVLQTTYLKILQGRAVYDERSQFKTWFFSVIRRTAIDVFRRNSVRNRRLVESNLPEGGKTLEESPSERIERKQRVEQVRRALAELPTRQREVLTLVFGHDASIREAAEILNISKGSASRHYERGKTKLREYLVHKSEFREEFSTRKKDEQRQENSRIDRRLGAVNG